MNRASSLLRPSIKHSSLNNNNNKNSTSQTSDTNNNNILLLKRAETFPNKDSSNNNDNNYNDQQTILPANNVTVIRKNALSTLAETSSNKSQLTVYVNNEQIKIETNFTLEQDEQNQTIKTSTPNNLIKNQDEQQKSQEKSSAVLNSSISSEHKKYMLNSLNKGVMDDEDNEKFYDHDHCVSNENPDKTSNSESVSAIGKQFLNNSLDNSKPFQKATRMNTFYSISKIVLIFFLIISLCILLEFIYCKLSRLNDANLVNYSCSGQMINTIRNRLYSAMSSSSSNSGSNQITSQNPRWISWSNVDPNSFKLDPIFWCFFTKSS